MDPKLLIPKRFLKRIFATLICSIALAPSLFAQSELIETGYHARGGSVGAFFVSNPQGKGTDLILGVAGGVSGNAEIDLGIAYASDPDSDAEAISISLAKHFHPKEGGSGRFAIFGSYELMEETYGFGGSVYVRSGASPKMTLVPSFDVGFYRVKSTSTIGGRKTLMGVGAGLSFVSGEQGEFLFVVTPQVSKFQDSPTVYGISFGFFSTIKAKPIR